MEGRRNSISSNSELDIRSMFATYDETPPSAQPWLRTYPQSPNFLEGLDQPQQDSVYYFYIQYAEASSSVAHDDHQPEEEHEPQPSHVEEPRPEVCRRNPTRNRRRPRNHLADDELPPGDSSNFYLFLGSREEPPGGERCVARRRVTTNPDSRFLLELPGGDEHPPGDADQFWLMNVGFRKRHTAKWKNVNEFGCRNRLAAPIWPPGAIPVRHGV
ncbi:hypothetical protein DEO72_LG7g1643 [Vigna unguiculata]|uniref:Uncharacterized protein n=1 Tax=Vigna unguiculata TaxID=3917 RepID=A0A4D6MFZ7_VIGUN|nr:hypothetical protein DEO72_LG7g1643 [Vigna unguiculata]